MIFRLELDHKKVSFGDVAATISRAGGDVTSIDVIRPGHDASTRDITVSLQDNNETGVVEALRRLDGIKVVNVSDPTFLVHLGGKITVQPTMPIKNRDDLSRVYTPGVAKVCTAIAEDVSKAYSLTIKRNTVAVVTDGTAVLGLGDIGPHAARRSWRARRCCSSSSPASTRFRSAWIRRTRRRSSGRSRRSARSSAASTSRTSLAAVLRDREPLRRSWTSRSSTTISTARRS